jgi:hypothetical protein
MDEDLEEFVGADRAVKAAPKNVHRPDGLVPDQFGILHKPDTPEKSTAAVEKPGSHSKIAHARPARNYALAIEELENSRIEAQAAELAVRRAMLEEADALANFQALTRVVLTPEALLRGHIEGQQRARAARVEQGLNPDLPTSAPIPGRSPLDQFALARGRQSQFRPSTPLRSPGRR